MNAHRLAVTLLAPLALGVMTLPQLARADDQPTGASASDASNMAGGDLMVGVVATATVKAVDPEKRIVTIESPDGNVRMFKVSKEAVNFEQVKAGDKVKAVAMKRVVVSVNKGSGANAGAGEGAGATKGDSDEPTIMRAPKGAKPGLIISKTDQATVRIDDVDALNRKVGIIGPDGKKQSFEVAPDVDVSAMKPGDTVTVNVSAGLALWVEAGDAQPAAATMKPGEAAGAMGSTLKFTVQDVDKQNRIVTLKPVQGGEPQQVQVGKEAINFDQIDVGDKVTVTLAEEFAVAVSKGNSAPAPVEGMVMARAPKGSKPRVIVSESEQVRGKIDSIDATKRTITLTGEGGTQTIKAGPKVDLSDLKPGDDVTARVTSAAAIIVEKP